MDGDALRKLATWALTHRQADNRTEALHTLATKLPSPVTKQLILDSLAGKLEPRKMETEFGDPQGTVTYRPHQDAPPEGTGEEALCAWLLSGAKVPEAKPLIADLINTTEKVDEEVLEKSLGGTRAGAKTDESKPGGKDRIACGHGLCASRLLGLPEASRISLARRS